MNSEPAPSNAQLGEGWTILMVEDHPDVLETGAEMLRDAGFTVIGFETTEAALEALGSGRDCDLLFTDIVIPDGIDGIELARRSRALRPDTPILLTTGWADRAREQGAGDMPMIGKPYRQSDLVRKICGLLGMSDTSG